MPKPIPLTGGTYQARSVIASAQRALNLYAEPMPQAQGEPARMAHYPTPGTTYFGNLSPGPLRGLHWASNGVLYAVSGPNVFQVSFGSGPPWTGTYLGAITPGLTSPVSMADNTLDLIIVDGSSSGWDINLSSNTMTQINDPNGMFSGADKVCYSDTYFLFNKPNTPQFYISGSMAVTFDPLDFANKSGFSDNIVTIAVARRELYLLGEQTTEVWFNAGAAGATDTSAFAYNLVQGVFLDHGCAAKYSVATYDNAVYWLSRNRAGRAIVMETAGYRVNRVSTYAIETALASYPTINDAIGFCYQLNGHAFYVLSFPSADQTWVYDITTQLWHEWSFIDSNGTEHRHRANCFANVDTTPIVGDYQTGSFYELSSDVYYDCIDQTPYPIKRERSFPHLLDNGRRVFYRACQVDMETGVAPKQGPVPDNLIVSLDWSDDRGHSYGNPVTQGIGGTSPVLGAGGDYKTSLLYRRLGMARDRVFRVSWTVSAPTSLQGAWVTAEPADQDEAVPEAAD